jgi:hypothetical protein
MTKDALNKIFPEHFAVSPLQQLSESIKGRSGQEVMTVLWIMACPKGLI